MTVRELGIFLRRKFSYIRDSFSGRRVRRGGKGFGKGRRT